ncbi:molybdopterin-dependent oxidoreductase [Bacteroidota bacterium]
MEEQNMKSQIIKSLLLFVLIVSLINCDDDKNSYAQENDNTVNDSTVLVGDGTTGTPNDGLLYSAESGPVRSALGVPVIDLATYQLEITGLVESPYILTWDEIQATHSISTDKMYMYCVEGWQVWGKWKGILVEVLLNKAHILEEGEYVLFSCVDGYSTAFPISYLQKYDAMLAYQVNLSPLEEKNGYPLRLVAFGKYGYKWAKWVNKLEVIDESQLGYWETQGYSDEANVPMNRRRYYEGEDAQPLEY